MNTDGNNNNPYVDQDAPNDSDDKHSTNSNHGSNAMHNNSSTTSRESKVQKLQQALLAWSKDAITAANDTRQGLHVIVASKTGIHPGTIILECPSASIALDPPFRQTHCGFCAHPLEPIPTHQKHDSNSNRATGNSCQNCHLIAICPTCHGKGASTWHSSSGECYLLETLAESFRDVLVELEGIPVDMAAQQIDSIYVITMRLLHRRHVDQQRIKQQQQQPDKSSVYCPLADIEWNLFDTLYSSPLPASSSTTTTSSLLNGMATLLQVMNAKLQNKQREQSTSIVTTTMAALNPQQCIATWAKCLGCCHAITDLSRNLGDQKLGMALFIPHSFYNHRCAPNAFLSCVLSGEYNNDVTSNLTCDKATPPKDKANTPCAVIARVVCSSDKALQPGESVSLSYIPLSGLCRRERQLRLQESYHFMCHCKLCDKNPISGSDYAAVLEHAVGGELAANANALQDQDLISALAPLRELQIDCFQKLMKASSMKPTSAIDDDKDDKDDDDDGNKQQVDNGDKNNDAVGMAEEDNLKTDLIEQSIATLHMAQRGIRNQKIPSSHEVSLECHRLLGLAYSLLRDTAGEDKREAIDKELYHHDQFFLAAKTAGVILDPSALAIQHVFAAECLREAMLGAKNDNQHDNFKRQYQHHTDSARRIARNALGLDHPLVLWLNRETQANTDILVIPSRKRKMRSKTS